MTGRYIAERTDRRNPENRRDKSHVVDATFMQRADEQSMKQGSDALLKQIFCADRLHGPVPIDALRHHLNRLRMHL